jgi:predicted ATP-dependent Lon-type protease
VEQKNLMPITSVADFATVPSELLGKVDSVFLVFVEKDMDENMTIVD